MTATDADAGDILSYKIDFGDGSEPVGFVTSNVFSYLFKQGHFNVTIFVADSNGGRASDSIFLNKVTVPANPEPKVFSVREY